VLVVVLVLENPDRFAIRLCAVRFGYLSEGDFSTDLDLVQEVGRLINGLIRSLSAPATSHQPPATSHQPLASSHSPH
jgi:hypothetical protein